MSLSEGMEVELDRLRRADSDSADATNARVGELARTLTENREQLGVLVNDAHLLGELALQKGVDPYAQVYRDWLARKKLKPGVKKRVSESVLQGWSLTARLVEGIETDGLVYVTMIGKDLNLYQLEYLEHRRPSGIGFHKTQSIGDLSKDMHSIYLAKRMQLPPSSHLTDNPSIISPKTELDQLIYFDPDAVQQGLLDFAKMYKLYES